MEVTLGGVAGIVIVANLMTVWLVWGLRRFGAMRGLKEGPGAWAWVAVLVPSLLAAGAVLAALGPLTN